MLSRAPGGPFSRCLPAGAPFGAPESHFGQVDVNDLLTKLISTGIIPGSAPTQPEASDAAGEGETCICSSSQNPGKMDQFFLSLLMFSETTRCAWHASAMSTNYFLMEDLCMRM